MKIHTIQLSQWRKLKNIKDKNIELVDITIKNNPNHFLSPTWTMVTNSKSQEISPEKYKELYFQLLDIRKKNRERDYIELLQKPEEFAIACFCSPNGFCHRQLAIEWLEKECKLNNIEFKYYGEVL